MPDEFACSASIDDRAATMEAGVALLRRAWTGDPFEHRGVQVRITPQPLQSPHPPILLGGSSPGAARRAARIADGFRPTSPELWGTYRAERLALGCPTRATRR
jgi:alkanesulfonate monooxygenase SsuD/methylene tetrahydromethanopterin reductase-like flavin-dependent oxidoreductase (luciferase family)